MERVVVLTAAEAEDAAARALMRLIQAGYGRKLSLLDICRELLRGVLVEDYSRKPGGYAMRRPNDPTLIEIGHIGAQLVELSYTVRDPAKARREACELVAGFYLEPEG